ncbi:MULTISPECIES: sugar transferase [unclassified Acidovorax]|uniref:sugar transferase n=1 Tax=unclassified Acidovorax TaxID=2684926 RepID=UPI0006F5F2BD|nr:MULTISPECIES: sugar transferase [unclassified Acidovorax]KRB27405.1 sugar transferase [Acidovorax sp. Root70]PUA99483.1 lipopolysaccharide/colanic/teichoic acid biosynthesis glycosyltransferase [Acidovorax sp. 107]
MPKRLFDLCIAAFGLLLLAPVLLAVALWVVWDSPGPALFRQQRVGRAGRLFRIYKFRTMHSRAEAAGPAITIGADARITRAGHWLRRTKADELPQLFNVLRGDMSLVGPRPEVPHYVALYPDTVRDLVLSVRPGITDRASIEFRDESTLLSHSKDPERTYVEQILPIKLRYAAEYARSHPLWTDVKIIAMTARALWSDRPAKGMAPEDSP